MKLSALVHQYLFLFLLIVALFPQCTSDSETPEPEENQYLVEYSLKSEFDKTLIQTFV